MNIEINIGTNFKELLEKLPPDKVVTILLALIEMLKKMKLN